jgi:putative hydrolase of the HAD superfamily
LSSRFSALVPTICTLFPATAAPAAREYCYPAIYCAMLNRMAALDPPAIDHWLFDLDNTLYCPSLGLFDHIDRRMGAYISRLEGCDAIAARTIQKRYFHEHGTTLAGLMHHHGVAPEEFLTFVHDIDLSAITPDPQLRAGLAALPGRRHVFTNADADYAQRVLAARGIGDLFDCIIDIRATGYVPKPQHAAYLRLAAMIPGFDPARALFVDDMTRNLRPAKVMGMTTVWLANGSEAGDRDHDPAHVDHHIDDLPAWLHGDARVLAGLAAINKESAT